MHNVDFHIRVIQQIHNCHKPRHLFLLFRFLNKDTLFFINNKGFNKRCFAFHRKGENKMSSIVEGRGHQQVLYQSTRA